MNKVILGNLSLYNGDDCLKFDGVSGHVNCGNSNIITAQDFVFECTFLYTGMTGGYVFAKYSTDNSRSYGLQQDGTVNTLNFWNSNDGISTIKAVCPKGDFVTDVWYDVKGVKTDSTLEWFIDGISVGSTPVYSSFNDTSTAFTIGCRSSDNTSSTPSSLYQGEICKLVIDVTTYVFNGNFGSPTLPSSPSGADGTINGTTWWKKDVDENFLTPQLYKSSWAIPMEQSQNVVYTDATPYYPTEDVFWNPYNTDLTYSFDVVQQGILSAIQKLLTIFQGRFMKFSRTVKGSDLPGSGVHEFSKLPVAIMSTGIGDLVVRFEDDESGDFTTMPLTSDGLFYPTGTIGAVDVDASSIDLNLVVFGVL